MTLSFNSTASKNKAFRPDYNQEASKKDTSGSLCSSPKYLKSDGSLACAIYPNSYEALMVLADWKTADSTCKQTPGAQLPEIFTAEDNAKIMGLKVLALFPPLYLIFTKRLRL